MTINKWMEVGFYAVKGCLVNNAILPAAKNPGAVTLPGIVYFLRFNLPDRFMRKWRIGTRFSQMC